MRRSTNKFHCDLRHAPRADSCVFDRLSPWTQVAFLAIVILASPLWLPLFFMSLIWGREESP